MRTRFKKLVKILLPLKVLFVVNLLVGLTQAQDTQSFDHWFEQTQSNPQDALAWFNLGVIYEKGIGVDSNIDSAKQSYSRSVALGYAPAMFNLGSLYARDSDYQQAISWWQKAADKNVPEAQYNLATLYEKGLGVAQDAQKAAFWYQRAAATAMQKYMKLHEQSLQQQNEQIIAGEKSSSTVRPFSLVPVSQANAASLPEPVQVAQQSVPKVVQVEVSEPERTEEPVVVQIVAGEGDILTGWQWLYEQPAEHYTVQLLATKKEQITEKFIQQYALAGKVNVIKAVVKEVLYYKVVLGSFPSWNAAAVEIGALPQDLREERPWIRTFSSLYAEKPEDIAINNPAAIIKANKAISSQVDQSKPKSEDKVQEQAFASFEPLTTTKTPKTVAAKEKVAETIEAENSTQQPLAEDVAAAQVAPAQVAPEQAIDEAVPESQSESQADVAAVAENAQVAIEPLDDAAKEVDAAAEALVANEVASEVANELADESVAESVESVNEVANDTLEQSQQVVESESQENLQVEQEQQATEKLVDVKIVAEQQAGDAEAQEYDESVYSLYSRYLLESSFLDEVLKQQLKNGLEARARADYPSALEQFNLLVDEGVSEAFYQLSLMTALGQGVNSNIDEAFVLAKRSAELGHPFGQQLLSELYETGTGTEPNTGLAAYWRQTAVDNIRRFETSR